MYRSILGESRFVFNSRKEMINYAGKLCMRSLTFEHSDSGKHIWKAGRRIVFFFCCCCCFLAGVREFELDQLATESVSWLWSQIAGGFMRLCF